MEKHLGKLGEYQLLDAFFKNKTIFITGHTGFQGSWLTLWLHSLGAKIVGYALDPPSDPALYHILDLKNEIKGIKGDIRDLHNLKKIMIENKPEIVFHLAAQSLVRQSYINPIETFETNVIGTVNILEAVKCTPSVKACLIVTSDKCYENQETNVPFKENDKLGGHDPYSASKASAELITSSFSKSFFNLESKLDTEIGIATIRAGNVIGGGDWAKERIVPDSINSLMEKKPIIIRNPESIRPWQFVLEPLFGMLILTKKMLEQKTDYNGAWNFGPSQNETSPTVLELVRKIVEIWGDGEIIELEKNLNDIHEARFLKLDSSKARKLLNWRSVFSTDEAIRKTVEWYRNYYKNKDSIVNYTLRQIQEYVIKARN